MFCSWSTGNIRVSLKVDLPHLSDGETEVLGWAEVTAGADGGLEPECSDSKRCSCSTHSTSHCIICKGQSHPSVYVVPTVALYGRQGEAPSHPLPHCMDTNMEALRGKQHARGHAASSFQSLDLAQPGPTLFFLQLSAAFLLTLSGSA